MSAPSSKQEMRGFGGNENKLNVFAPVISRAPKEGSEREAFPVSDPRGYYPRNSFAILVLLRVRAEGPASSSSSGLHALSHYMKPE